MKVVKTVEAEGMVLCHDITQIIKGVTKDAVFRKGHVVRKEDIPVLLSVGKENLYVWENKDGMLHEDEGAEILCEMCINDNMRRSETKEGKIELFADCHGLLKINNEALKAVNAFGQLMIASRHGNFSVKEGDKIAGTRIIPLVIEEEKMLRAKKTVFDITGGAPIYEIKKFNGKKVGVVTTGNEVFYGRIKDTFTPVIIDKIAEFGGEVLEHIILEDDDTKVTAAILELIGKGADMVVCTGGMSVDPDDKTPLAIKNTGAEIITYGAPVLPGAMFLLAYFKKEGSELGIPVMGLPGCVMYAKRTIFDLILPRVMADDKVSAEDLVDLGQGGLCLNCEPCTFPNCGFGK
ncbi:MAG: molybdopterin-binding protein [Eubacteriales bacterium]|nr:molybdopterin-binding protein [Eubacteriales bacterium]MDY3332737.1 molybdopterin-binding protein [Gallibacter sp.]